MGSMKSIGIEERTRNPFRTTYTRDENKIIYIKLQLVYSPQNRLSNDSITTTGASSGRDGPGPYILHQGVN
jgi:hypothetical protein